MAEAYDVTMAPHCPLGPIALAASLQIAFSMPNFLIQEQSIGIHYNQQYDLLDYVWTPNPSASRTATSSAATRPGLGIEIDEKAVRRRRRDRTPLAQPRWRGTDGGVHRVVTTVGPRTHHKESPLHEPGGIAPSPRACWRSSAARTPPPPCAPYAPSPRRASTAIEVSLTTADALTVITAGARRPRPRRRCWARAPCCTAADAARAVDAGASYLVTPALVDGLEGVRLGYPC